MLSVFAYKAVSFSFCFFSLLNQFSFCFLHEHKTPLLYFNIKSEKKCNVSFFYRYAMTVWYFDAEERAEAKKKFRNLTGMILYKCSPERIYCILMYQSQRQTGSGSVATSICNAFLESFFTSNCKSVILCKVEKL